jgi:hypothetical protein
VSGKSARECQILSRRRDRNLSRVGGFGGIGSYYIAPFPFRTAGGFPAFSVIARISTLYAPLFPVCAHTGGTRNLRFWSDFGLRS